MIKAILTRQKTWLFLIKEQQTTQETKKKLGQTKIIFHLCDTKT